MTKLPSLLPVVHSIRCVVFAGLCLATSLGDAATGLSAGVRTSVISGFGGGCPGDCVGWTRHEFNSTTPITLTGTRQFELSTQQGSPATTTFGYETAASSRFGALSALANVTVQNPQKRGTRPEYLAWVNGQYLVNPGGIPDGYSAESRAAVTDTISLTGAEVTTLQFRLHLEGTLAGSTEATLTGFEPFASIQLDQRDRGKWSNVYFQGNQRQLNPAGNAYSVPTKLVDAEVWSNPFPLTAGSAVFTFELWAMARVEDMTRYGGVGASGGSFSVSADFSNTMRVVGVRGFDANGMEIALGDLVGESGTVYAGLTPVPEPSTWALGLMGMALMLTAVRKRRV